MEAFENLGLFRIILMIFLQTFMGIVVSSCVGIAAYITWNSVPKWISGMLITNAVLSILLKLPQLLLTPVFEYFGLNLPYETYARIAMPITGLHWISMFMLLSALIGMSIELKKAKTNN